MRLEPLSERHVGDLETLVADPDVLHFTRVPEPAPPGFARGWVERYARGRTDGRSYGFAAIGDDGTFLGLALAPSFDPDGLEVELGYIVTPAARGRGVAVAMVRELTRWAFEELGAQRSYLLIDAANAASLRVAERAGYVHEGVMRSVHLKQGRRIDQSVWSRLPTDP